MSHLDKTKRKGSIGHADVRLFVTKHYNETKLKTKKQKQSPK